MFDQQLYLESLSDGCCPFIFGVCARALLLLVVVVVVGVIISITTEMITWLDLQCALGLLSLLGCHLASV